MKHKFKIIAAAMLFSLTAVFTACQMDDNPATHKEHGVATGPELITIEEAMSQIKSEKIKSKLRELKRANLQKSLLDSLDMTQVEVWDMVSYKQYILFLNEYTVTRPYFLYYIVTKDRLGVEKSGYLRFTPSQPTQELNIQRFTGIMQLENDAMEVVGQAEFSAGSMTTGLIGTTNCYTEIIRVGHNCTNGGEHPPGVPCNPGYVSDAHYSFHAFTWCETVFQQSGTPNTFIGGGGGLTNSQRFYITRSREQQEFMDNHNEVTAPISKFIKEGGFFHEAEQLLDYAMRYSMYFSLFTSNLEDKNYSDASMKFTQWGLEFLREHPGVNSQQFEGWMESLEDILYYKYSPLTLDFLNDVLEFALEDEDNEEAADMLLEYMASTTTYSAAEVEFASWAVDYLTDNPDVTAEEFENWFMGTPETTTDLDINPDNITYDAPVTQQALPSLSDVLTNFPKLVNSGHYYQMPTTQVYTLVGGSLLNSHINNPLKYNNACAIRGSRALLYSGIHIPVLHDGTSQRTQKGGDNKNYILDAVSFDKFMRDKFGAATHSLTLADANDPEKVAELLKGKTGIYVIVNQSPQQAGYTGHVDMILDGKCIGGAYTRPNGGVKSIRIWILD